MKSQGLTRNQVNSLPRRRDLFSIPAAAGLAAALPRAGRAKPPVMDEHDPANIKLCRRLKATISDDDLLFLSQLGLRWARVNFHPVADLDFMAQTQRRYGRYGIKIFSGVHYAYRELDVQLGRPGRDKHIETYHGFLRNCGQLGIGVSCYDFHPANTYTTAVIKTPRGYKAREFKLSDFRNKVEKQRFEREYAAEEIWDHYTYFMQAVLPVAKEAGVKLALHPDDPPLAMMNGVGKIFVHYDGYRRAEEISDSIEGKGSPHWGLTFCVGTWSEGGDKMGKNVFEMIRDFGARGKILGVHFRNVSSPLPHFHETFLDEGYMDMYQVMKSLREVRYNGTIVPDHIPEFSGDRGIRRAGTAYTIAYMRALLRRANEEAG